MDSRDGLQSWNLCRVWLKSSWRWANLMDGLLIWALEMDSKDGLLEMYSRAGLTWWVVVSHCQLHGGEGWRSSRPLPIHHSCNISPFKCQRSLLPLYWVDRLPDKVHLGADKDVKDETLIRFRKAGIPDWGSLRKKNTKRLFSTSKICATITLYKPVSGLVGQIQFCLLQAEWHPRALGHHLDVEV